MLGVPGYPTPSSSLTPQAFLILLYSISVLQISHLHNYYITANMTWFVYLTVDLYCSYILGPPKLNSLFIVSNLFLKKKKHAGKCSLIFFIMFYRFYPSSQCKIWPHSDTLMLSQAWKPVQQCRLNFSLVSMMNNFKVACGTQSLQVYRFVRIFTDI